MPYHAHLRTDRLRALCEARGITAADLAEALDMNPSTISRLLRGITVPSNAFLAGCAVVFGQDQLGQLVHIGHDAPAARHTRRCPHEHAC